MRAMGIVPWIRRDYTDQPPAGEDVPFVARRLRVIAEGGHARMQTGSEHARLLVVVETSAVTDDTSAALTREQSSLLSLMLRAIGLEAGDYSVCALANPADQSGLDTVADLLTPGRRAMLMLTQDPEILLEAPRVRAHGREWPVFRVAHPASLLAEPAGKRQAWQVLKALQPTLQASL